MSYDRQVTLDQARRRASRRSTFALLLALLTGASLVLGAPRASATVADGSPIGHLDIVETRPSFLHVAGWALDPEDNPDNSTHTVAVSVFLDGQLVAYTPSAVSSRPDVGAALPYGDDHGFDLSFGWSAGAHQICAFALNPDLSAGADTFLGCIATTGTPIGNLESVEPAPDQPGTLFHATGWTLDPDSQNGTPVAVFLDGSLTSWNFMADHTREDVSLIYPYYGPTRGFDIFFTVPPGSPHTACIFGQNIVGTDGNDTLLGCTTVDSTPTFAGNLDAVAQTDLGLSAIGWIVDPAQPAAAVPAAVFLDGELVAYTATANSHRADVGAATPYGADHGFELPFFASPGRHTVCVTSTATNGVDGVFRCVDVVKTSLK